MPSESLWRICCVWDSWRKWQLWGLDFWNWNIPKDHMMWCVASKCSAERSLPWKQLKWKLDLGEQDKHANGGCKKIRTFSSEAAFNSISPVVQLGQCLQSLSRVSDKDFPLPSLELPAIEPGTPSSSYSTLPPPFLSEDFPLNKETRVVSMNAAIEEKKQRKLRR